MIGHCPQMEKNHAGV